MSFTAGSDHIHLGDRPDSTASSFRYDLSARSSAEFSGTQYDEEEPDELGLAISGVYHSVPRVPARYEGSPRTPNSVDPLLSPPPAPIPGLRFPQRQGSGGELDDIPLGVPPPVSRDPSPADWLRAQKG
jgi:hypothetical protein